MKQNYPMYNDGFVSTINYEKLIKMQSQEPIVIIERKVSLKNQNNRNKVVLKKNLKRTISKVSL